MTTTLPKSTRGGARPGAGRPRKEPAPGDHLRTVAARYGMVPLADIETLLGVTGEAAVRAAGVHLVRLGAHLYSDAFALQNWVNNRAGA